MVSFRVISLNVRGIRDYRKRQKLYCWLSKQGGNANISFIQEAHCTPEVGQSWKPQWASHLYFSCGTNQSRGVITLFGKTLEYREIHCILDQEGRFIIIQCEIQGKEFIFINKYAPNTEPDQVLYFTHLRELFLTLECGENASFVWGGDFNCPLTNRDVDKSEVKI